MLCTTEVYYLEHFIRIIIPSTYLELVLSYFFRGSFACSLFYVPAMHNTACPGLLQASSGHLSIIGLLIPSCNYVCNFVGRVQELLEICMPI